MNPSRPDELLSDIGHRMSRLGTAMSVRARIVILALIPVAGLGIIGAAYLSGERAADAAFQSVRNSSVLAGASNEFRAAVVDMRVTAQVFATRPNRALIDEFSGAHAAALASLDVIESSIRTASVHIGDLRENVSMLKLRFDKLLREQELLGFGESSGIEGTMRTTASAVERILNQEMAGLGSLDAKSLLASLSTLRRYESEYRLNRTTYLQVWFFS
ncbi:MAG: hypothetical protein WD873_01420, partial [Candidatus Hydrogenedentales bacterium]